MIISCFVLGQSNKFKLAILIMSRTCLHKNCSNLAEFSIVGGRPILCHLHKLTVSILEKKTCQVEECKRLALYGYVYATHCVHHKIDDMKLYESKPCSTVGCFESASTHPLTDGKCGICFKSQFCVVDKCYKCPSYSYCGVPTHCEVHKLEDMKYKHINNCSHKNCNLIGYYYNIANPCRYCVNHKPENARMSYSQKCGIRLCNDNVVQNEDGILSPFCFEHSDKEIYFKSKARANQYNEVNDKLLEKWLECEAEHLGKLIDVIDSTEVEKTIRKKRRNVRKCTGGTVTVTKTYTKISDDGTPLKFNRKFIKHEKDIVSAISHCIHVDNDGIGCPTYPTFNYKDEPVGIYCKEHKLKNMISCRRFVCSVKGCSRKVTNRFTRKGLPACSSHGKPNFFEGSKCFYCDENVTHEFINGYVQTCNNHKKSWMVPLISN